MVRQLMRLRVGMVVCVMLFLLAACGLGDPLPEGVTAIDPAKAITDVTLTSMTSAPAVLSEWQGDYVLLAFGYTNCPDVCPLTLAEDKAIKKALGDLAAQVKFVLIGVDTARDTPERLTEYLGMFDPEFIGLTGEQDALKALADQFEATYKINDYVGLVENYTVDHTASKFLLNPQGRWIRKYAYGLDTAVIAADMAKILSQR